MPPFLYSRALLNLKRMSASYLFQWPLFTTVQSLQTIRWSDFKIPFRGHSRFVDRLSCFFTLILLFYLSVHLRYSIKLYANVLTAGHSLVTTQVHFNAAFLISAMPSPWHLHCYTVCLPSSPLPPVFASDIVYPSSFSSFSIILHNWSF